MEFVGYSHKYVFSFYSFLDSIFNLNESSFQVLITILVNLLLLDVSFSYAFPTVIIPALTGLNEKNNPNETIQITGEQSSWIGIQNTIYTKNQGIYINKQNLKIPMITIKT